MPLQRTCSRCDSPVGYYAKGMCKPCYMSAWRSANAAHLSVYDSLYRREHAELIRITKATYRQRNKAKTAAYNAAYYSQHRLALLAQYALRTPAYRRSARQRRSEANRVYAAGYRRSHPEVFRDGAQRYRSRLRSRLVEHVSMTVVYSRDRGVCQICGKPVERRTASLDHILPIAYGGDHSYRNVRLTHWRCNQRRQHRGPAQLRLLG